MCTVAHTYTVNCGIKGDMCAAAHIYTVNHGIKGNMSEAAHISTMALKEICVQLLAYTCQPWHIHVNPNHAITGHMCVAAHPYTSSVSLQRKCVYLHPCIYNADCAITADMCVAAQAHESTVPLLEISASMPKKL